MNNFVKAAVLYFVFAFCCGCSEDLRLTRAVNDSNDMNRKEAAKKGSPVAPGYTYMTKKASFARELEVAVLDVGDDRVDTVEGDAQKLYKLWVTPITVNIHLRVDPKTPAEEMELEFAKEVKRLMVLLTPKIKNHKKNFEYVSIMGIIDAPANSQMGEIPLVVLDISKQSIAGTDWESVEPETIPELCRKEGGTFQAGGFVR